MSEPAPGFSPLVVAPRWARIAAALIGPLLWVAGFVLVAVVANQTRAIAIGCAVAAVSLLVSFAVFARLRRRRIAEEEEVDPADAR
jgi:hypothetical protein